MNAATCRSPPQCFLNAVYHPPGRRARPRQLVFVCQYSAHHQHAAATVFVQNGAEGRRALQHLQFQGSTQQQQFRKCAKVSGRHLVPGRQGSNRSIASFFVKPRPGEQEGANVRGHQMVNSHGQSHLSNCAKHHLRGRGPRGAVPGVALIVRVRSVTAEIRPRTFPTDLSGPSLLAPRRAVGMENEGQPAAAAERASFVVFGYLPRQLSRISSVSLAEIQAKAALCTRPGLRFMVEKKAQRAGFPTRQADPARQAALRSWRSGRNPGPDQGLSSLAIPLGKKRSCQL